MMNPIGKEDVYESVLGEPFRANPSASIANINLANIMEDIPETQEKLLMWNVQEQGRVEEIDEFMKGAATNIENHHQAIIHLGPTIESTSNALKKAYLNCTDTTEDAANIKAALLTGLEATERFRAHEKTSLQYVTEMERRLEIITHKLTTQAIHVKEHGQVIENHFSFLKAALAVLDGQLMPMEQNIRALVTKRLHVDAERIVAVIRFGFLIIMGCISLGLYLAFGVWIQI